MNRRILFLIIIGFIVCIGSGLGLIVWKHYKEKRIAKITEPEQPIIDIHEALHYDNVMPIVIIGSGCAGLSAAVYGARSNIKTLVITGNQPGGQLTETTYVENWPGSKKILGSEIVENLKQQAMHFGALIKDDNVVSLDCSKWPYVVKTADGNIIHALSIIIATGATPMTLNIPGEREYFGKGVTTCAVCDAPFHKGHDVLVVGGGDSAAEEALQLTPYAKTVTIVVRRDKMRASAHMQQRIAEIPTISIIYNHEVKEILGDGQHVTSAVLYNNATQETTKKLVGGVFLAIGHTPNSALVKPWIKTDIRGYIMLKDRTQETSRAAIFAAGDVEDYQYRQAGVAAGSGIKAALDAVAFLQEFGFNAEINRSLESKYFDVIAQQSEPLPEINNLNEWQELLKKSSKPVMIDFYTQMCSSCKHMMPAMQTVAHTFKDSITIVKADAEKAHDVAQQYRVTSVPCILVFKKGALVARYNQAMNKQELTEFVQKIITTE